MTNNEMINRFKDMADLAEASYAELHYVIENIDSVFESRGGGGANRIYNDKEQKLKQILKKWIAVLWKINISTTA